LRHRQVILVSLDVGMILVMCPLLKSLHLSSTLLLNYSTAKVSLTQDDLEEMFLLVYLKAK
ncbi:hypothetical protein EC957_009135, partial [Mortierella hygrophila]